MRTSKVVLLVIGIVVLVVAAIWTPVAAPQLTKLPTSLNINYQFTGTYTGYVDQSTGARLSAPQNLPLSIRRDIKAVPAQSTSSELVVDDAQAVTIGPSTSPWVAQYMLDRSTSVNVKSSLAYAQLPGNVLNRSGSYSLGPPPGVNTAKTYSYWVDEIGKTIPITYANATQTTNGLAVQEWKTNLPATSMLASMVNAMHLPTVMPFATFEAQLKAQGTDLAAALRILSTSLTAAEKTRLAALTATPIPLQYFYASQSTLLIEPTTGMIVDMVNVVRAYSVRPNVAPLIAGLTPILAAHPTNPVVPAMTTGAKKLAAAPAQPLYTLTFHQTPASVTEVAGQAGHNASMLRIFQMWIPIGLGVIGLMLVGLAFTSRRRREPPTIEPAQPGPQKVGV